MKTPFVLLIVAFVYMFTASSAIAQDDKAEIKFWKDKAKAYKKNPLALRDEFKNYQDQISDLKRRNKEMAERLSNMGTSGSPADSMRASLQEAQAKLAESQKSFAELEDAYKTLKRTDDMGIRAGLIYGVQIGAYVYYEMENVPADANDVIYEKSDGFNKYVIGNFRTYEESINFRDELRKTGVKDAWVVPYIDGVRVTIDEARRYEANQGNF